MKPVELSPEALDAMCAASGVREIEVHLKRGRSRRFVRTAGLEQASEATEQGFAVRGATPRGSFLYCGTGEPAPELAWPEADGRPVRLPAPKPVPPWKAPRSLDAPLASDSEMRALIASIEKDLLRDLPKARIDHLVLEDGQSRSWIGNSLGLAEAWSGRAAGLTVEASIRGRPGRIRLEAVRREVRELAPRRLASRLVDLLSVLSEGRPIARDRSEVAVAPRVAGRLLAGLWPLFDPRSSDELILAFGAAGKLGSRAVTVIDDGRLPGGVFAAPVDGEGTATQQVVLVEEGVFRQPLLAWDAEAKGCRVGGCSRRPGWRDEPRVGPTHLYVRPDPDVRASELVTSLARGYYLLDCASEGLFDFEGDRFSLPVRGFELLAGRATGPVAGVVLTGRISALLGGVRAVARDLAFVPTLGGLVGAPTLRLGGLELRETP